MDAAHGRAAGELAGRLHALASFHGRYRMLHLTWIAFLLTFVVWFNFAPFASSVGDSLGLSREQLAVLAIANVALTVPARVLVGMALDRWGPRRVYSAILVYAAVPCLVFATARSFPLLVASRLALSVVGAGFVVGIRLVAEWFPPRELGLAEGVYGGWGNFGSAVAAFTLPGVAAVIGGPNGWRWAVAVTGLVAAGYGLLYLRTVGDTPEGRTYARPRRQGALEVTSRAGVLGLLVVNVPLLGILAVLTWRLTDVGFLSPAAGVAVGAALAGLLVLSSRQIVVVNRAALRDAYDDDDRYPFRSVAVLCLAYLVTFGSELAVVSMLPTFFAETFGMSAVVAGATASAFAFTNLVARPAGGAVSDLLGSRRRTLQVLLVCLGVGYLGMAAMGAAWPAAAAVAVTAVCSLFVQAGEGAVYAIVPLVKPPVSGQISGLVGAYGSIGAVTFLTVLSFVPAGTFFLVIAAAAGVAAAASRWLPEPRGSFAAEHLEDVPADAVAAAVNASSAA
ncbi:MAG: NarK family nitrate/nitrite MFS transporter [Actinomycetota bacterium]|nr:NarK family nitrate/nitrite MFS transporter [Actinomycetota bacterium]